jgi:hypothetical protein
MRGTRPRHQSVSPDSGPELEMRSKVKLVVQFLGVVTLAIPVLATPKGRHKPKRHGRGIIQTRSGTVLWQNPINIASRNLFYGPGGKRHTPPATFVFVKEDLKASNPKFVVRDSSGVGWKIKLGAEARPETVASRLVWAVGYFANEDYFLREVHVKNLPAHLQRGQQYVGPNGSVYGVRLKRYLHGEKKIGSWHWRHNPFTGTRELGGLRVMMALINNWDLTDDNTSVYRETSGQGSDAPRFVYMVSDLGSSLGTTAQGWKRWKTKGNLNSYHQSKFVRRMTPEYGDFSIPTLPPLDYLFNLPQFVIDARLPWIGRHIPRADVRWIAQLLARLSPGQISDAFRAAGYSEAKVQGFTGFHPGCGREDSGAHWDVTTRKASSCCGWPRRTQFQTVCQGTSSAVPRVFNFCAI